MNIQIKLLLVKGDNTSQEVGLICGDNRFSLPSHTHDGVSLKSTFEKLCISLCDLGNWPYVTSLSSVLDDKEYVYIIYKTFIFNSPINQQIFKNVQWIKYENLSTIRWLDKKDIRIIRETYNL